MYYKFLSGIDLKKIYYPELKKKCKTLQNSLNTFNFVITLSKSQMISFNNRKHSSPCLLTSFSS